MPVDYVIDPVRRLVITTCEGRVTFAEAKDHQNRMLGDPAFDPTFDQLIDATAATELVLSEAEAIAIADRSVFSPLSRRAFVATQPEIFSMGRMLQVYAAKHDTGQVFSDLDSALKWLGLAGETRPDRPIANRHTATTE